MKIIEIGSNSVAQAALESVSLIKQTEKNTEFTFQTRSGKSYNLSSARNPDGQPPLSEEAAQWLQSQWHHVLENLGPHVELGQHLLLKPNGDSKKVGGIILRIEAIELLGALHTDTEWASFLIHTCSGCTRVIGGAVAEKELLEWKRNSIHKQMAC